MIDINKILNPLKLKIKGKLEIKTKIYDGRNFLYQS